MNATRPRLADLYLDDETAWLEAMATVADRPGGVRGRLAPPQ